MFKYYKYIPEIPTYGEEMKDLIRELNAQDVGMAYRDAMRAWIDFSQDNDSNFLSINEDSVTDFIQWLEEMEGLNRASFIEWQM